MMKNEWFENWGHEKAQKLEIWWNELMLLMIGLSRWSTDVISLLLHMTLFSDK